MIFVVLLSPLRLLHIYVLSFLLHVQLVAIRSDDIRKVWIMNFS